MCSLFLTLLFLFSLSCLIYVDASLSSSDRLKVINAFNQARCQVTPAAAVMNNLRWDSALEFAVQQYVDSCPTNINNPDTQASSNYQRQGGKEGEIGRIVALANVDDAISQWKAEANIPDPFRCQLDEVMTKSRYTQLVWTNSVNVACATPSAGTTCQNFALTVCYFFPAGNVKNELPYVATGAAMRPQTNACLAQDATTLPTAAVGSVTSPPIPATSAPVTSAPVVPAAPPNTQPEQAGGGGTTVNGGAVAAGVLIPILLIIVGVICYIKRDALKRKWTNHRNKTNEAALKSLDIANHNKRGAIRNDNYYDPGKKVQHEGGYGRSESTIDPPDAGDEIMTSSPLQGIMISTPTVMTSPTIVNARNPAPYSQQAHSAPYSSQQTHSVPYSTGPYSAPHTTTALSVPTRHQQQESLGEDFMSNPMASMPTSNFELLAAQVCARPTARPFENYPSATSTTPSYDEEIPPPMPTKKKKKGAPPSHKPRVQPTYDDVPPRGISVVHHHNDSHQHIHVHHIHQHIHVHGTEEDVPPPPPSGGPPADVMRKKKKGAIRMHGARLPRELEY